jgi:Arc/MetJ family transcription regulator
MAVTSIDLDPKLVERAKALTGERSNRAVVDLALRRLIASKQKDTMIDGIATLTDLEAGLGAPVVSPPASDAS